MGTGITWPPWLAVFTPKVGKLTLKTTQVLSPVMREISVALVWHSTTINVRDTLLSVGHRMPIVASWSTIMGVGTVKGSVAGCVGEGPPGRPVVLGSKSLTRGVESAGGVATPPFSSLAVTACCNCARGLEGRGDRSRCGCGRGCG